MNYKDYFYLMYNMVQHPDFLYVPLEEPEKDVEKLINELLREVICHEETSKGDKTISFSLNR